MWYIFKIMDILPSLLKPIYYALLLRYTGACFPSASNLDMMLAAVFRGSLFIKAACRVEKEPSVSRTNCPQRTSITCRGGSPPRAKARISSDAKKSTRLPKGRNFLFHSGSASWRSIKTGTCSIASTAFIARSALCSSDKHFGCACCCAPVSQPHVASSTWSSRGLESTFTAFGAVCDSCAMAFWSSFSEKPRKCLATCCGEADGHSFKNLVIVGKWPSTPSPCQTQPVSSKELAEETFL